MRNQLKTLAIADLFDAAALHDTLYQNCSQINEEFCTRNNLDVNQIKQLRREYSLIVKLMLNKIKLSNRLGHTLRQELKHCRTINEIDNVIRTYETRIFEQVLRVAS